MKGNEKIQKPLQERLALDALLSAATTIATQHKMDLITLLLKFSKLLNENHITTNKEDFKDG